MGLLRILIAGLLLLLVWRAAGAVRDWWGERRLEDGRSSGEEGAKPLRPCRQCGTYLPEEGLDQHGLCARCRDGGNADSGKKV